MADRIQEGMEYLSTRKQAIAGRSITYTRGATSATLVARLSRSRPVGTDQNNLRIYTGDRDYVIPVSVLILGGSAITPQVGDRITDSEDAGVYEVRSIDGRPCFERCDGRDIDFRIHTIKVS